MGLKYKYPRVLNAVDFFTMLLCLIVLPVIILIAIFYGREGLNKVLDLIDSIVSDMPRAFKGIFWP